MLDHQAAYTSLRESVLTILTRGGTAKATVREQLNTALNAADNAGVPRFDACVACGAGPTGRCDPPDEHEGECPHGCSPER